MLLLAAALTLAVPRLAQALQELALRGQRVRLEERGPLVGQVRLLVILVRLAPETIVVLPRKWPPLMVQVAVAAVVPREIRHRPTVVQAGHLSIPAMAVQQAPRVAAHRPTRPTSLQPNSMVAPAAVAVVDQTHPTRRVATALRVPNGAAAAVVVAVVSATRPRTRATAATAAQGRRASP